MPPTIVPTSASERVIPTPVSCQQRTSSPTPQPHRQQHPRNITNATSQTWMSSCRVVSTPCYRRRYLPCALHREASVGRLGQGYLRSHRPQPTAVGAVEQGGAQQPTSPARVQTQGDPKAVQGRPRRCPLGPVPHKVPLLQGHAAKQFMIGVVDY